MEEEYSEQLGDGGKLIVTKRSWSIRYYFPGPDLRYKGTFYTIPGRMIDRYISAWVDNYNKYIELKKTLTRSGEIVIKKGLDMYIRVGGYTEGVCVAYYHMPIKSQGKLDRLIKRLEYAKIRSAELMEMLQKV